MCTKQGIFRCHLINAFIAFIVDLSHEFIDFSKLCQFFEVIVHLLIRNHWQSLVVFKLHILVFLKNSLAVVVQFDNQTIGSLDCRHFDVISFDVASTKVENIRITQSREALEEKNITHTFKSLLRCWDFELSESVQLFPR